MEHHFSADFILSSWHRVFGPSLLSSDFDIGLYNAALVSKGFRSDECSV